jgi:hypothetical protein
VARSLQTTPTIRTVQILPFVCSIFAANPYRFLFNGSFPLSFSDYWVSYQNQQLYLDENEFLVPLNNEIVTKMNDTYKQNFISLSHLLMVQATEDTVIYPFQVCNG